MRDLEVTAPDGSLGRDQVDERRTEDAGRHHPSGHVAGDVLGEARLQLEVEEYAALGGAALPLAEVGHLADVDAVVLHVGVLDDRATGVGHDHDRLDLVPEGALADQQQPADDHRDQDDEDDAACQERLGVGRAPVSEEDLADVHLSPA
jgi:hypothetical protein